MAGPDAHKRSVVKHRTRAPQKPRSHGGFAKLKADLIHKAKVKKAYYKLLEKEGAPEPSHAEEEEQKEEEEEQELGRFAPEDPDHDLLERVSKKDERPRVAPKPKAPAKKKLPYFYTPPKQEKPKQDAPKRTREEALAERDERRKLWNKKSPSQQGRARGQPDLGARMQVMLDKIQRSS